MGVNLLNGGIIVALISVPIIVSIGEDALKAVPDSYREAALVAGCQPLGDRLPRALPGRQERPAGRRPAGRGPLPSAKPWPC